MSSEELNDGLLEFQVLVLLVLGVRLDLSNGDRECTNEWLLERPVHQVENIALQGRTVESLRRQVHIECQHGVDVGVRTRGCGVGLHVRDGLGLCWRQQGLDSELDI